MENLENPNLETLYFEFCIAGRTKGNRLSGTKFAIPCAAVTSGTNLRPGRWAQRHIKVLTALGKTGGYLFTKTLENSKLMEFEDDFFSLLEEVQVTTSWIRDDVDVRDDYGILRSLRRGVTAHAINMQVPTDLIRAINRWRHEDGTGTLDIIEVYAQFDALKPTMLRYSLAL